MKISECENMEHLADIDKDATILPIDIVIGNDDERAKKIVEKIDDYGVSYFSGVSMMQMCVTKVLYYWDEEMTFGRKVTNFVFVFFKIVSIEHNDDGTITLKGTLDRKCNLFNYSEPYPLFKFIYTNLLLGKFKIDETLGVPIIEIVDALYDVAKEEGLTPVNISCL